MNHDAPHAIQDAPKVSTPLISPKIAHVNPPRWTRIQAGPERDRAYALWCLAECRALKIAPANVVSVERTLTLMGYLASQKAPTALL